MKKCSISLIKLFVLGAALFSTSFVSHAGGFASEATCYPLVHGENGMGSTNSLNLPHMRTFSLWYSVIYVTNVSNDFVNVKLNFKRYNGDAYHPVSYDFDGEFNSGNSPFSVEPSGAILKPGRTAKVTIFDDSYTEALVGSISWQADSCINEALSVSVRSHRSSLGTSIDFLNGGQPF